MPSIEKNVIFNYIGQFYVAFIGILILPLYLKHMGSESYGLIGIFTLLQSWMLLLDLGLSPTLGREVAILHSQPQLSHQLRSVVRSLEMIFIFIALTASLSLFFSRNWIAHEWLNIKELDFSLVSTCIGLMAVIIGIRWLAALHRSGINAYEQQVWMNIVDVILVTLRFPGSLLLIIYSDGNLLMFFGYQLSLALVEQLIISFKFYSLLPQVIQPVHFSLIEIRRIAPFALGIAYTGGIWIITTQLDKLLLSKVLPLAEYGYFVLVATLASGITVLSGPISKAVLPRMTALLAQGNEADMLALYRKASRLVTCMVTPVTLVLAFFPRQIVYIWTGDNAAAEWAAPILPLFIIGNGLLAILAFQYYLQYAHGKLRLHILYNTVYIALIAPLIFYAVTNYGPIGAGVVWLGSQVFSLLVWMPFIHKQFAPGIHLHWFFKDFLPAILIGSVLLAFLVPLLKENFPTDRLHGLILLGLVTSLITSIVLVAGFCSNIKEKARVYF